MDQQPVIAPEPNVPKKSLKQMTVSERREYGRNMKAKSRDKAKQARLAAMVPAYAEYQLPDTQRDQLAQNSGQMIETIAAELLHELTDEDERMVEMMADVILSHERKWTKEVHSPTGCLYGRYFVDSAASELIEHVHRFPNFLKSPTFKDLYKQFLTLVRKLVRNESFDPKFAKEIEAEISGVYKLRTPKVPKPPEPTPPKPELKPELNFTEIVKQSQIDMLERLQDQLDPSARQYLYGVR